MIAQTSCSAWTALPDHLCVEGASRQKYHIASTRMERVRDKYEVGTKRVRDKGEQPDTKRVRDGHETELQSNGMKQRLEKLVCAV